MVDEWRGHIIVFPDLKKSGPTNQTTRCRPNSSGPARGGAAVLLRVGQELEPSGATLAKGDGGAPTGGGRGCNGRRWRGAKGGRWRDQDGQHRRTATKPRDLNPQWGERLEFLVPSPGAMATETLELNLYKAIAGSGGGGGRKSGGIFLGKVKVAGASFAKEGNGEASAANRRSRSL